MVVLAKERLYAVPAQVMAQLAKRCLGYRPLAERLSVGCHVSNGTRFLFRWMCVPTLWRNMVAARGVPHSEILAVNRAAGTRWHNKNRR